MHVLGARASIAMSCDGIGNSFLSLVHACRQKRMPCTELNATHASTFPECSNIAAQIDLLPVPPRPQYPNIALAPFSYLSHPSPKPKHCFEVVVLPSPPSPKTPTLLFKNVSAIYPTQPKYPNVCYLSYPSLGTILKTNIKTCTQISKQIKNNKSKQLFF